MRAWLLILICSSAQASEPAWNSSWRGIPELISVLGSVPEGKKILDLAKKKNPTFQEQLHMGDASFTESTFVRTYSLLDGKEKIELRHEVTLSKKLNLADAVVDLAHELVHFTDKGMLDPYQTGFALKEFVRNGIEGQGGELAALKEQCHVAWALEKNFKKFPTHLLCTSYHLGKGFDFEKAKRDYYSLGAWFPKVSDAVRKALPELTAKRVQFNSSYAGKPYPVALAEEFNETRQAACVNNRKKYRLIAAQADERVRGPASSELQNERMRLKLYDENFCRDESKQTRK